MKCILIVFLFFCSGCYKDHLYVQQEWVDLNFLASTRIGTPDPRQNHPPEGQRLLVGWDFPRSLFDKELQLVVTVRLWDQTEKVIVQPIERKRDATAFFFPSLESRKKPILTYRVQVFDKEKEIVANWEHQLWTEWVDVDVN